MADFVSVSTNSIWTVEMHLVYTRSNCIHNNSSLCVRSKTFCCCVSDNQACATPHLWRTAAHNIYITDITCVAGWVNWMQKWNGSISTTDRPDFYRTNVFKLKHSHCLKQLTNLFLNTKSQMYQLWKWIHFVFAFDSACDTCGWLGGRCLLRKCVKAAFAHIFVVMWLYILSL